MVDVSKLISFGNLLVRKVTWFMLSTTSAHLSLCPRKINGVFGADHITRISSRLTITHSLTFWLPETDWLCQLVTHSSRHVTWVGIYSAIFFSCSVVSFGLVPFLRTASDISSNSERDKRPIREKTHPSRIHCYISVYWYLAWNT